MAEKPKHEKVTQNSSLNVENCVLLLVAIILSQTSQNIFILNPLGFVFGLLYFLTTVQAYCAPTISQKLFFYSMRMGLAQYGVYNGFFFFLILNIVIETQLLNFSLEFSTAKIESSKETFELSSSEKLLTFRELVLLIVFYSFPFYFLFSSFKWILILFSGKITLQFSLSAVANNPEILSHLISLLALVIIQHKTQETLKMLKISQEAQELNLFFNKFSFFVTPERLVAYHCVYWLGIAIQRCGVIKFYSHTYYVGFDDVIYLPGPRPKVLCSSTLPANHTLYKPFLPPYQVDIIICTNKDLERPLNNEENSLFPGKGRRVGEISEKLWLRPKEKSTSTTKRDLIVLDIRGKCVGPISEDKWKDPIKALSSKKSSSSPTEVEKLCTLFGNVNTFNQSEGLSGETPRPNSGIVSSNVNTGMQTQTLVLDVDGWPGLADVMNGLRNDYVEVQQFDTLTIVNTVNQTVTLQVTTTIHSSYTHYD
jgi:hypothetical protein